MTYVILDLEWNGTRCEKLDGYFNEIIEIGAVKLSSDRRTEKRFDAYIRPVVSRKLTRIVTDLTGITDAQIRGGVSFVEAMEALDQFIGKDAVIMTWSNTDLMVLLENCRYFYHQDRIPFLHGYLDLQNYAQTCLGMGTAQQVGLGKMADLLGITSEGMKLHHAIDDSVVAAAIFRRVFEPRSFKKAVLKVNEDFYRRLTFKATVIKDITDPLIRRSDLRFSCENCKRNLKRMSEWKFQQQRFFTAAFQCRVCEREYIARVQAKRKFDGVEIKKRLIPKVSEKPKTTEIK
mgnify:CR=1 FL=1